MSEDKTLKTFSERELFLGWAERIKELEDAAMDPDDRMAAHAIAVEIRDHLATLDPWSIAEDLMMVIGELRIGTREALSRAVFDLQHLAEDPEAPE